MSNLIQEFKAGHEKMGGVLHVVEKEKLVQKLNEILENESSSFIHHSLITDFGLPENPTEIHPTLKVFHPEMIENEEEWRKDIRNASAGITGAIALIAFSGTVVMSTHLDNSRLLSLSPERNIILAKEKQLITNLDEFFDKYADDLVKNQSQFVFVTGTSRTADIEKKLIRGVHGPTFFDVVLVKE
ncbi:MAG: lactate utilization protein C [Calditrichia bacterium]